MTELKFFCSWTLGKDSNVAWGLPGLGPHSQCRCQNSGQSACWPHLLSEVQGMPCRPWTKAQMPCHLEQSGPGLIYSYLAKCHKTLPRCFQCQLGRSCPKLFQEAALPTCRPNPHRHGTEATPDPCSIKHQANHADIQPWGNASPVAKLFLFCRCVWRCLLPTWHERLQRQPLSLMDWSA